MLKDGEVTLAENSKYHGIYGDRVHVYTGKDGVYYYGHNPIVHSDKRITRKHISSDSAFAMCENHNFPKRSRI